MAKKRKSKMKAKKRYVIGTPSAEAKKAAEAFFKYREKHRDQPEKPKTPLQKRMQSGLGPSTKKAPRK